MSEESKPETMEGYTIDEELADEFFECLEEWGNHKGLEPVIMYALILSAAENLKEQLGAEADGIAVMTIDSEKLH